MRDAQPFHHREANPIDERKVLIGVAKDDLFGSLFIQCPYAHDDRRACIDVSEELDRSGDTELGEDQGVSFDDQDVGHERPVAPVGKLGENGRGFSVMLVITIEERQVGR